MLKVRDKKMNEMYINARDVERVLLSSASKQVTGEQTGKLAVRSKSR